MVTSTWCVWNLNFPPSHFYDATLTISGTSAWDPSSAGPDVESIKYYAKSWRCYYHYHDVDSARFPLFISLLLVSALFSTCLTKLWDLQGPRAFREAKKYFKMTDQFIALKCAVRGPSHIITPGTSFGMNIDPKWSPRERQCLVAQPSRRLSSSPPATFLETCLSAYRALL